MAWFVITPRDHLVWIDEWPTRPYLEFRESNMGLQDYVELIERVERGDNQLDRPLENVFFRILDPNFGKTKSAITGRTLQDDFAAAGLVFDCRIDDKIEAGHLAVKERLRDPPTLFFLPHCKNLIHSMQRYCWDEFKQERRLGKETPSNDYKDFPDLVRYACMYDPRYFSPKDARVKFDWAAIRNGGLG